MTVLTSKNGHQIELLDSVDKPILVVSGSIDDYDLAIEKDWRWSMEAEFLSGLKLFEKFVELNERPNTALAAVAISGEVSWTLPEGMWDDIKITYSGVESDIDKMWCETVTKVLDGDTHKLNELYQGVMKIKLQDSEGKPIEQWTLNKAWVSEIDFRLDTLSLELNIKYGQVTLDKIKASKQ